MGVHNKGGERKKGPMTYLQWVSKIKEVEERRVHGPIDIGHPE